MRAVLVHAVALLLAPAVARADEPRSIDFAGGIVVDAPFAPGLSSLPGVALDLRWFDGGALWLGGGASFEAAADLSDPERGELVTVMAAGAAAGVHRAVTSKIEVFAGVRVDAMRATDWPMATEPVLGVRGGPQGAVAIGVGNAWGHPMSVELRATWHRYWLRGVDDTNGWQAGAYVVGVLFPDR